MKIDQYLRHNGRTHLREINYQQLPNTKGDTEFKTGINDDITVDVRAEKGLLVIMTRNVTITPAALFALSVTLSVEFPFNKNTYKDINWSDVDLRTEIVNDSSGLMNDLLNRVSLIIAQITAISGDTPLVTPPILMMPKKK